MAGLGMPIEAAIESGRLTVQAVDPAELSPGEFAQTVRLVVERPDGKPGARVVVIDSLNGYLNAMPEERFLSSQLHELLTYLGHQGVVTFLVVAQHGVLGASMQTPVDTSYLADAVILFRYFESRGEVRQALSVVKKRSGRHERTIREFRMDDCGIHVGDPLRDMHGVLSGTPVFRPAEESPTADER
jgi:circadian clock protein KaiC